MTIQPIDDRVYEVLEEASTSSPQDDPKLTVLSSGVVLRHKRVPPMILARVDKKFPDPPIPMIHDEEKERNIPNPDDPDYLKALKQVSEDKGVALIDILIGMGTTVEYIPDNVQHPDDEEWVENLLFVGIEVPYLKLGRYLAYVKYYAAEAVEDIQNLAKKGSAALGVTEAEVAAAIAGFQSKQERSANSGDSA